MFDCLKFVLTLFDIYYLFLICGVFLSWLPFLYKYRIFQFIGRVGDWYMRPFNGVVVLGPLDFTPIVGFIIYNGFLELVYYLLP